MKSPLATVSLLILSSTLSQPIHLKAQLTSAAQIADLPRHGVVGLTLGPADSKAPENPTTNPPTVISVAAASAGEAAGIQRDDVMIAVDSEPVNTSADFVRLIGRRLADEQVRIGLVRAGQKMTPQLDREAVTGLNSHIPP